MILQSSMLLEEATILCYKEMGGGGVSLAILSHLIEQYLTVERRLSEHRLFNNQQQGESEIVFLISFPSLF